MILDSGHLLYDGSFIQLHEKFSGQRQLLVDFAEEYQDVSVEKAVIAGRDEKRGTYKFDRFAISASQLIEDLSKKYRMRDLEVKEPDFVFIPRDF